MSKQELDNALNNLDNVSNDIKLLITRINNITKNKLKIRDKLTSILEQETDYEEYDFSDSDDEQAVEQEIEQKVEQVQQDNQLLEDELLEQTRQLPILQKPINDMTNKEKGNLVNFMLDKKNEFKSKIHNGKSPNFTIKIGSLTEDDITIK